MRLKLAGIITSLLLSGCMGMNKKFDCPMDPGVTCKSVSAVNDLVDQGILPQQDLDKNVPSPCLLSKSKTSKTKSPKTLSVWFAPEARDIENVAYRTINLDEKESFP
jgi:hypothetical protein